MEEPNPLKIFENDPSSVININDGKLPPQAIDLEEAVIGAMLIDEKGVDEVKIGRASCRERVCNSV
jgi:replicative DNA helicase